MPILSWRDLRILRMPSIGGFGFLVESQNLRGISIGIDRQCPANFMSHHVIPRFNRADF